MSDNREMANIEEQEIVDIMAESMGAYSAKIILDRAIPDYRDGLKPVQRKILWKSHEANLHPKAKHMTLQTFAGLVLAYHPHADTSVSGALVKMTREWVCRAPLMEISGNNGSIDGNPPGAPRYVKTRQTNAAALMLKDIEKNAVNMIDNHDSTLKMPEILPSAIPNALINGAKGMAIGMETTIIPHNPKELLLGMREIVNNPSVSFEELIKIIPGPDFPTGGTLIGHEPSMDEMVSGRAKYTLRGEIEIHDDKNEPYLEITEIPYRETTDNVVKAISNFLEKYSHLGIEDVDENTDNGHVSILIKCAKGTDHDTLEKIKGMLYRASTKMQVSLNCNNLMIVDGRPMHLGIKEYLERFIDYRIKTLKRIWQFEKEEFEDEREAVETAFILYENVDLVVKLAKQTASKSELVEKLMEEIEGITERQAGLIAQKPIYRLSTIDEEYFAKHKAKFDDLTSKIDDREKWLSEGYDLTEKLNEDIDHSLEALKDVSERKTKIIDEEDVEELPEIKPALQIESKPVRVVVKKDLTAIRIGEKAYSNQIQNYENDDIIDYVDCMTDDYVLMITKYGKIVTRLVDDLVHSNLDGQTGEPFNRVISEIRSDDEFVGVARLSEEERIMVFTKRGYMKVCDTERLAPSTKTRGYMKKASLASGLKKGTDEIIHIEKFQRGSLDDKIIKVTIRQNVDKRLQEQTIELENWLSRNDSGGSSGARAFNTRDGKIDVEEITVQEK